jgi:hypothetical protein
MEDASGKQETIVREDVRPGLTMIKRRTRKPDGRYLIYYEFERESAQTGSR